MVGRTHMVCSAASVFAIETFMSMGCLNPAVGVASAAAIIGGLIPDIDLENTKASNKLAKAQSTLNKIWYGVTVICMVLCVLTYFRNKDHLVETVVAAVGIIVVIKVLTINPYKYLKHRGITHAPIVWVALYYLGVQLPVGVNWIIEGVALGAIMHIVCDMFNSPGCPLLFPLVPSKVPGIMKIKTRSKGETVFGIVWCASSIVLVAIKLKGLV